MSKGRNAVLAALLMSVVAADQVTKWHFLKFWTDRVFVINGWLSFRFAENTGAAWNILSGHPLALAVCGILVLSLIYFFRKKADSFLQEIAFAMIAGGIVGNTIDRIVHGYVIDFISVDLQVYRWPTFNIADSAISCGVIILLFTFHKKTKKAE